MAFRLVDDQEQPQGRFSVMEDAPAPAPVRFMDEPSATEKFLAGIRLPEWMDNLRGSLPYRVMQGMADPVVGAVQTAANVLPDSTGIPQAVNARVTQENKQYEDARAAAGSSGIDLARAAGNVVSPANLALAKLPIPASLLGRAAAGAGIGAIGGAMQPVNGAEDTGFFGAKAGQVAGGAVTGAVLTPVLGAVGDAVVRKLIPHPGAAPEQVDAAISSALDELGQTIHDVPPQQLAALRAQVNNSLQSGKQIDAAAALRKGDFDALGLDPTLGQITRDPMQFARERNLRGIDNIGEPLSARFSAQGNALQGRLSAVADGASDAYDAGRKIAGALKNTDDTLSRHVSGLYGEARQAAGKDLDVPLTGLAQDYAQVLADFGDKIPGAIQKKFADLGVSPANPSNQLKVFSIEDANKLLQNINAHVGNDPATNRALGRLRDAVKGAVMQADASGGPFAPAVKAASERFQLQDAVPALKAAANGDIAPEDFVRKFIVNGKTDEVRGLSDVLKQAAPEAWQEARAQIGDTLKRAAFRENVTGDRPFAVDRFNETLRRIGKDKLAAFFSPGEIEDLTRVGRVAGYINQAPNASAVSTSNSQVGLINVLSNTGGRGAEAVANTVVPGSGIAITALKKFAGPVKGARDVRNALRAIVPSEDAALTPDQVNALRALMAGGAAGFGGAAAADRKKNRVERNP